MFKLNVIIYVKLRKYYLDTYHSYVQTHSLVFSWMVEILVLYAVKDTIFISVRISPLQTIVFYVFAQVLPIPFFFFVWKRYHNSRHKNKSYNTFYLQWALAILNLAWTQPGISKGRDRMVASGVILMI